MIALFGLLEFYLIIAAALFLGVMLYLVFHNVAYKNLYKRFKQFKRQRYGFYECGFRPKHELSVELNLFVYVLLALVILYDVEGVFLLFFMTALDTLALNELILIALYLITLLLGLALELLYGSTT